MRPGGVGKRCCFVACVKFMSANSHRAAAPCSSHLGNFMCFWRITSLLRVKSNRDDRPLGVAILATFATFGASFLHLM